MSEAQDRVDAVTGLAALAVGFAFQAAAYAAGLGHAFDETPRPGKAVVAVGTTALAAIAVLAVSHFTRRRLVKKLLPQTRLDART